jgi:hypothetical protein
MRELIVTSGTLLHAGGLAVAGRLKAKTLRVIGVSQLAATPSAMHAAGTPPVDELSAVVGWTLVALMQSNGSLHTFSAPAPVPSVIRPPNAGSNDETVTSFGTRTAVRTIWS